MNRLPLLLLFLFPTTLFADTDATTKKYPPYPDVWGYVLPQIEPYPGQTDYHPSIEVAKMPNGDFMFTYVQKRTNHKRNDGSCCDVEEERAGLLFFAQKKTEFVMNGYDDFWRDHRERKKGTFYFVSGLRGRPATQRASFLTLFKTS